MNATARLLAVFTAPVAFTGCATKALMPPKAELRGSLGRICVVADTNVDRIRFQVPDSKADIAAERLTMDGTIVKDAVKGAVLLCPDPHVASVTMATAIVFVGGAPVWQEMRRGVGLLVADSADKVARACAAMDAAVTGVRFEEELRERLAAELATRVPDIPLAASPHRANTLLELMVYEPAITGREGINPGLSLRLGLRVRLLDARTRGELYYDYLDYQSASHTLVDWAAEDALIFRAEIERCLAHLSSEISAQLFLRPSNETASRHDLAAAGISRRPPQLLSASSVYATKSLAVYNPPVYAYGARR